MSYKNNAIHVPYWQMQIDENVIHINKYRFLDFYYEELEKLNMKYYHRTHADDTNITTSIQEEESESTRTINEPHSLPVNIPGQPQNIRRYRLDSQNTFNNLPMQSHMQSHMQSPMQSPMHPLTEQPSTIHPSVVDLSISPQLTSSRSLTTSNLPSSLHNKAIDRSNTLSANESNSSTYSILQPEYYTPSTNHQMIVKRVYDNYLCINIDNVITNTQYTSTTQQYNKQQSLPGTQAALTTVHDFISDQLAFIADLITPETGADPFKLFNNSTIGLLFDRMNKSGFPFQLAHTEIVQITRELTKELVNRPNSKQVVKQGLLDASIGIIKRAAIDLLQPGIAVANVLVISLTDFIGWVYKNYSSYWMNESLIQISIQIAADLGAKFGAQMITNIYITLKKYFIPSYLFSVSRTAWKFTTIHKREISRLRSFLIPPTHKNQWIIKCIEHARSEISWVYPDTPQIRNLIVFIDGRNWFYADEYVKTTGGVNLELLRQFLCLPEYQMTLADLVYGRISSLMSAGRQLHNLDPRYIIPVCIFNERHRNKIQPLVPSNRIVIYTPRGQDDDLLTLYLWLSNPGSFIASNDNYGNHVSRLSQHVDVQAAYYSKYYEGLWAEMVRCFKIVTTPMSSAVQAGKTANRYFNQNSSSPPF